jgi:hypothetical protein
MEVEVRETTVEVTSTHAKPPFIAQALAKVSGFLKRIEASAEQSDTPHEAGGLDELSRLRGG